MAQIKDNFFITYFLSYYLLSINYYIHEIYIGKLYPKCKKKLNKSSLDNKLTLFY